MYQWAIDKLSYMKHERIPISNKWLPMEDEWWSNSVIINLPVPLILCLTHRIFILWYTFPFNLHCKKHRVVSSRYIYAISFKYQKEISLWINKLKLIAVKRLFCRNAELLLILFSSYFPIELYFHYQWWKLCESVEIANKISMLIPIVNSWFHCLQELLSEPWFIVKFVFWPFPQQHRRKEVWVIFQGWVHHRTCLAGQGIAFTVWLIRHRSDRAFTASFQNDINSTQSKVISFPLGEITWKVTIHYLQKATSCLWRYM